MFTGLSDTESSALWSWMCVNLLWRMLSVLLMPVTRHRLRSVIWAGSRHCRSRDSLLLKKGQSPLSVQTLGPHQSRGWTSLHDLLTLTYPNSSTPVCSRLRPRIPPQCFQNENLPFHRISRVLQGEKEIRLLFEPCLFWAVPLKIIL